MKSWNRPGVPALPGRGEVPRIWDTATSALAAARPNPIAGLYVCGITPYDATHLGHAATYLAFDGLIRLWLDSGADVRYVQNVTDVDDPLLERAAATGVDWRDLAAEQTELFRGDMESLAIIPPDHYVAVTEMIEPTADAVQKLLERDIAYRLEGDIYFDSAKASVSAPWNLGDESHLDRDEMLALSAERGGDPERVGKRDALDPMLWRGPREGDPSWDTVVGAGRPGWHIECAVIGAAHLDLPMTVTGGGADLAFPHHEFSAGHAAAMTGKHLAMAYSHGGLVAYQGEKMSKSLGNLVLVSKLTAAGADPRAIRLAILGQHYREDWEWTDNHLPAAEERLERWQSWASAAAAATATATATQEPAEADDAETPLLASLRATLANDLDFPGAIALIDAVVAAGGPATPVDLSAIDALLGIRLV